MLAQQINSLTMREFADKGVPAWWEAGGRTPIIETYSRNRRDPTEPHKYQFTPEGATFGPTDVERIAAALADAKRALWAASLLSMRKGHLIVSSVAVEDVSRYTTIYNTNGPDPFGAGYLKMVPEELPVLERLARQCAERFLLQWTPQDQYYHA